MRRYWVKRVSDDEEVIGTYFDHKSTATAVASALKDETGNAYYVSKSP